MQEVIRRGFNPFLENRKRSPYKFDIQLRVDRHNGVTVYEVEKY